DELLPTALQQLGHPVQHLAAVVRGRTGPAGKSLACRGNRVPDVLAGRERGVGQEPAARVVDRVAPAGLGPRESPTDVELVGLRHSDPLSHCLPSSQGDHPGASRWMSYKAEGETRIGHTRTTDNAVDRRL